MWGHAIPLWRIIVHPLELPFSAISPSLIRLRGNCPTIFWSQFVYCRRWRAYLHGVYQLAECLKKQHVVTAVSFVLQYFWLLEHNEIFSNKFLWPIFASKIACYEVSDIEQKETCRIRNAPEIFYHRNFQLQPRTFVRSLLFFAFFHSGIMDNMAVNATFNMPGGDDFRHVTSVFNNAARG